MIFLVLLLLPILEIFVLIRVGSQIGIINTLFALIAAGILGAGFAKAQGRYVFQNMQMTMARGEIPGKQLMHGLLLLVGGILFLIPGFISDFVGLFFVLPGTRHLIAFYLKARFAKRIASGNFRVFTTGFNAGFGRPPEQPYQERNVTPEAIDASSAIIDVTPDSSTSDKQKK